MEKAILRIEALEPEIVRAAKDNRPENSRKEYKTKQDPESATVLLEQKTAEPGSNRIAQEKTRQGPRGFIQLHAQIGSDGPRERKVHEKTPPRMEHLRKSGRSTIAYFGKRRHMRVTAKLEHNQHEHEERHEEMQAVKLGDATEHERKHGDSAVGVAKLACEQESGKDVKNARSKSRSRNNRHDPLAIGHVSKGAGTAQMEHHDIDASQEAQTIDSRKII